MNPEAIYDLLKDKASDLRIDEVIIGRTWTLSATRHHYGLAMSPEQPCRTLPWSGTLQGKTIKCLSDWLTSWNPFEATVALSAINAGLNQYTNLLTQTAPVEKTGNANLDIFEYFLPRLRNKNVVVVGRYPGLEKYENILNLTVLERNPGPGDLPDSACEYVIPKADWVFLTASSIVNKTFPRLAELASDTNLVLMGPSVPWLSEFADFGVDFLAGVDITNGPQLRQVVSEGGGVRIFDEAVSYRVLDLGQKEMAWHHMAISDLVTRREDLKKRMESWYNGNGNGSFPAKGELLQIDRELSKLDSQYKRLWDARHAAC